MPIASISLTQETSSVSTVPACPASAQVYSWKEAGATRISNEAPAWYRADMAVEGPRTVEGIARGRVNFAALDLPGQAARIRLGSTVVGVKHEGDPQRSEYVSVLYTRGGKLYRLKARAAVMAGGNWTTRHIVLDLPQQPVPGLTVDRREQRRELVRAAAERRLAHLVLRAGRLLPPRRDQVADRGEPHLRGLRPALRVLRRPARTPSGWRARRRPRAGR